MGTVALVLGVALALEFIVCFKLQMSRNRLIRALAKCRQYADTVVRERDKAQIELFNAEQKIKSLTIKPAKAQDTRKRFTAAELRKANDKLNAEAWPQERPNSEILKEQEDGRG